jgi:hypothetical protein
MAHPHVAGLHSGYLSTISCHSGPTYAFMGASYPSQFRLIVSLDRI